MRHAAIPLQGSIELLSNHRFSPHTQHDSSHFICYGKGHLFDISEVFFVVVLLELFMLAVFVHNFGGAFLSRNEKLRRGATKIREPN